MAGQALKNRNLDISTSKITKVRKSFLKVFLGAKIFKKVTDV